MQKDYHYISPPLSSRLKAYMDQVEASYERIKFYKKHWHLVDFIDDLEIFTVRRFTFVVKNCGVETSRETVSTFMFYLHLDSFLEFTPVKTLMKRVAHVYNLDTIDPEKKAKAIYYYESINPQNHVKHEVKKNKQIQTFISSYESGNVQSAAYKKGRLDRAAAAQQQAKGMDKPEAKEIQKYKAKDGYAGTKAKAQRKKKQSSIKSKK